MFFIILFGMYITFYSLTKLINLLTLYKSLKTSKKEPKMNYHRNYTSRETSFPAPTHKTPKAMVDAQPMPYDWFKSTAFNPNGVPSAIRPNGGSVSINDVSKIGRLPSSSKR